MIRTTLLIALVSVVLGSCDPKTTSTGPTHETKLTVQLSGEFKDFESADVSFDGGGITTIKSGETAYSAVDPGEHTIFATAHILKGTWTHKTTINEGETKLIVMPCDKATLTVTPDILWLGECDQLDVKVVTDDGTYQFAVAPGATDGVSFRPRAGVKISVYNDLKLVAESTNDFFYQDKLNLIIPFK